ncbi:MAG: 3-deoxy-D-manno-octulosonate 8-phosphate phosphatase [Bacteroidetes bacterium 4484_276]|nr:MAG: 3-deoxy-D-manno-octulosonate 8-phosphate phosphatase [Bacteroidetes bacterium 4484_276]OYT14200.1 MAG: 3-deoxy-D-manno-octulosonate 8-phosphate phosphatase [Bacteroidetes bacterium 4572_114]
MVVKNYKELLKNITTLIFDYDGVFTDGKILLLENGDQLRTANVKDGYALQLAIKKGYRIVVISGGTSDSIKVRLERLGVHSVFIRVEHKIKVYNEYLKKYNLSHDEVLFMGDDIPDYQIMKEAGVAVCPADAAEEIKSLSHYISHVKGGDGCVRDILEQVMKVQGKWMMDDAFLW